MVIKMGQKFVIGMDGGGTATVVRFADLKGERIAEFRLGGLNVNGQKKEKVIDVINQVFRKVRELEMDVDDCMGICVGAAGISNAVAREVIESAILKNGMKGLIKIVGDQETALVSAVEETHGVILIAGTGSICFGRDKEGNTYRSGGYGHIIDDEGSAYAIGRDILTAVIRDYDGRGSHTILTRLVQYRLQFDTTEDLVQWVYDAKRTKKEIAALAVLLEKAVEEKDEVGNAIQRNCVVELFDLAKAVIGKMNGESQLVVSGSVLLKNREIYKMLCGLLTMEYPDICISKMKGNPSEGAVKIILSEIA